MKRITLILAAFATFVSLFAISAPAEAFGRVRGGVFLNFGVPWPGYYWGPRYYYGPGVVYYDDYYYPPPAVIVTRPNPPEYIERSDVEGQQQWWYWCPSSSKYYPYVKECSEGFQRVPAQPAPPANR